jgi:hypothetical protein
MTNLVQLALSGSFVDGFIYRTQLYVVTSDGELRSYEVRDIEERLSAQAGRRGDAIGYLLFHSRGLGASLNQVAARRSFDEPKDISIDVDGNAIPHLSYDLGLKGRSVLDVLVYYDHMFVASTEGFWSTRLPAMDPRGRVKLERRLDSPSFSADASMGSVAVSGEAGLTVLFDEFSWLGNRHRKKASNRSIRAEYAGRALVNYRTRNDFRVLTGTVQERSKDTDVIVDVSPTQFGLGELVGKLQSEASTEEPEFTSNVRSTFIVLVGGQILTVPMRASSKTDERFFQRSRVRGHYTGRVVGAAILGRDLLLETQSGVLVLQDDSYAQNAYEGDVTALRVFPHSRRYLQLALVVGDKGLILMPSPSTVGSLSKRDDW